MLWISVSGLIVGLGFMGIGSTFSAPDPVDDDDDDHDDGRYVWWRTPRWSSISILSFLLCDNAL